MINDQSKDDTICKSEDFKFIANDFYAQFRAVMKSFN